MKTNRSFILCATDFSTRASAAASVAAKLAQRRAEKLLLVHASDAGRASVSELLRGRLEAEADELRKSGAEVEAKLLNGRRPSDALLSFIREHEPTLIVVACAVKGALDRWALGSFSESIAEGSPVPTLVVRNPSVFDGWDWMKSRLTILLALDQNPSSDVVLRWAKEFRRVGPCDFVAGHVNFCTPTYEESAYPLAALANPPALQERLERAMRNRVRDQIGDDSVDVIVRPRFGDPGPVIVEIADEKKAHLIAIGAHQRRGIHRLAQFSVSRDVLHQSDMNVMCVPVTTRFDPREAHIPEFHRVLVTTDFSELGNTAVPFGCGACSAGGLLKIVHVASPRRLERSAGLRWTSELRSKLRALIPGEMTTRGRPPEVEVLANGDVAQAICDEAERFGADLVCMTSHGSGASQAFHGSVAKAVLKRIRRPLLVIRRPE